MNRLEYLLNCVTEEAAEVQQVVSKAQRFGLDSTSPRGDKGTNEYEMLMEFEQMKAVIEMLTDEGFITPLCEAERALIREEKKAKVEKYIEFSRKCGRYHD